MKQPFSVKAYWQVLKLAGANFMTDKVLKLSASLAYYTIFSIAPMTIVIMTLLRIFIGQDAINGLVYGRIKGLVGPEVALQMQDMIKNVALYNHGTLAAVMGVITLIIGATSVFSEIQDSINMIWQLKAKPKTGLLKVVLNRLLSFSMIISMGFILLVSLMLNGLIELLSNRLTQLFPEVTVVLVYIVNVAVTFLIIASLFAGIFKILPDARIRWGHVAVGAITTAVLFMLGRLGIGFYLGMSKISSSYGAASSIVIILLWVYYSAAILYFGAEFTRAWVHHQGARIYPNDYAVWVKQVSEESTEPLDKMRRQQEAGPAEPPALP
ncbi:YihY/virulence factor BrkB family protein [Chitinophaga costaii]|nr:YihY/virulence factor BrkB family protein [Chitinophaga costaii]PUZ27820.1 YihY/virulence factor BrkB family protein [Chitinophaga costaii]